MRTVRKAVAAVIRKDRGAPELLVFTHPLAGVQIPKGTVEPDETIEQATRRELREESGLALGSDIRRLGIWQRTAGAGPREDGEPQCHEWIVSAMDAPDGLPGHWRHAAEGSPEEVGLIFAYHWLPIDKDLSQSLHPLFSEVAEMIVAMEG